MKHVISVRLAALALLLVMTAFSGMGTTQAQGSDKGLIPVCVQAFESPVYVDYLTQAQIDEIEATWAAYDQSDIPPPQITGYPDPTTESCATENGVLKDYDPAFSTPVCVPSGPERDGPLVPQFVSNHYLPAYEDVILADPETGACLQAETSEPLPVESGEGATGLDIGTYGLHIMARNCDDELTVFFTKPQEGCVPGAGAFFNVTSDSGEFLGNCEAALSASNPAALFAGCTVQVPYGSTGVVTEDLASIPNYAPFANSTPFYAPPNSEPVDGEDYGPIFVNVLQSSADVSSLPTELPNTGVGPASDGSDSMLLIMALSSVATLLGFAAVGVRQQA